MKFMELSTSWNFILITSCVFYRARLMWRLIGCGGPVRLQLLILVQQPITRRCISTTRISSAAHTTGCTRIVLTGLATVIRWSLPMNGKVFQPTWTLSRKSLQVPDPTTPLTLTSSKVFILFGSDSGVYTSILKSLWYDPTYDDKVLTS